MFLSSTQLGQRFCRPSLRDQLGREAKPGLAFPAGHAAAPPVLDRPTQVACRFGYVRQFSGSHAEGSLGDGRRFVIILGQRLHEHSRGLVRRLSRILSDQLEGGLGNVYATQTSTQSVWSGLRLANATRTLIGPRRTSSTTKRPSPSEVTEVSSDTPCRTVSSVACGGVT